MNTVQQVQQIDTGALKKFAQTARRQLREQVAAQLDRVLKSDSAELREKQEAIKQLKDQIAKSSREAVIDRVAYTWFNRFCALRFMDVNRYTRMGTVSPPDGFTQPEILAEAKQGHIDESLKSFINEQRVFDLLSGRISSRDPQQEAYRLLLVAVCNYYNSIMPFLFEKIADYTELLMPDDLLSDSSILADMRKTLTVDSCKDVEVIGWLYQFYISEKKDEVFEELKKNKKITPENIPAATQLFTPHWIVRYLVENSLGRLWMLNKPASRLVDLMDYYIRPQHEETGFVKISSPEDLRVCDPACGSGHMLVYAFDLLHAMYEEEGYEASDIPRLILENNLYGLEIDERAGALAAFALVMKARARFRRFLVKPTQPNICVLENVNIEQSELKPYLEAVGFNACTSNLQETLHQFKECDNFGSLIKPALSGVASAITLLEQKKLSENLFFHSTHERVSQSLRYADYLSPKYHVVIANPPYMGNKGMNAQLRSFLEQNYTDVKSDLFSAFITRIIHFTLPGGFCGMMTPFNWMFLSSFEQLRQKILTNCTIRTLVRPEYHAFFESAFVPICGFILFARPEEHFKGVFIDLQSFYGADLQPLKLLEAIKEPECGWSFRASASDFGKVPGKPIVYWIGDATRELFSQRTIGEIAKSVKGLDTCDNNRFVRYWPEVDLRKTSVWTDRSKTDSKWFPYCKGGNYRKWWGNYEFLVDWENDGAVLRNLKNHDGSQKSRPQSIDCYFKKGITFSSVTSSLFSCREMELAIFGGGGNGIFTDFHLGLIGFLNSKVNQFLMQLLNPTLNMLVGDINRLPFVPIDESHEEIVQRMIAIARDDWNSFELSWSFAELPLLKERCSEDSIEDAFTRLKRKYKAKTLKMQKLEEANNRAFITAYNLEGQVKPEVSLDDITLLCNPRYRYGNQKTEDELDRLFLEESIRELVSYAVGCMFGRYSLDKPGLLLVSQGATQEDFLSQISDPSFSVDEDNVIPILDGDWFIDDISERFRKFLRVTFGDEHYHDNLRFVETSLGKDIRKYFLKDFYTDHVKRYKKRPIYWLFSSPKGTFNALIYMHRYRPDTVSVVLNDYLREFRNKLSARKAHLESVTNSPSVSAAEKTKALKEIESLKRIISELDAYERDVLYPLATEKLHIDLDDGVKVNYTKFGKALKTIPGMASEED